MTFPLQAVPLCPYYTEAIFVRGVGGRGALVLCVSVQGGGGEGSREGTVYLYNLSNSPVLISEGPPSIYLDYPCRSAASFLLPLLLLGCVYVRVFFPYPLHVVPGASKGGVSLARPLSRISMYSNNITLQGREVCSLPFAKPFLSGECLGGHLTASPHPLPGIAGEC